jgi:hypothetical protein
VKQDGVFLDGWQVGQRLLNGWAIRLAGALTFGVWNPLCDVVPHADNKEPTPLLWNSEFGGIQDADGLRNAVSIRFAYLDDLIQNGASGTCQHSWHVFHHECLWTKVQNQTNVMIYKRVTGITKVSQSHVAKPLTRWSAKDQVNVPLEVQHTSDLVAI